MTGTILYGLDNMAYRADPALSYSESKLVQRSPVHLKFWRDHPELRKPPTGAQAFGIMVHCALLEPECFDQRYWVGPAVSKNSNDWKDFVARCLASNVLPTTEEDRIAAFSCAANVRSHPVVGPLFKQGHAEVSVFWTDPATGLACKARLDWVTQGSVPLLLDLKTTDDASREAFRRSITNYQYNRQASWYEDGYARASGGAVSPMLFIAVESKPPHAVAPYTIGRWFMAQAAKDNLRLRTLWKHCLDFDDYPGYDPAITDLDAPRYALDEELRELQREEEAYS